MEQPPPLVLALVIADHIHRDDETAKAFILGTRFTIEARRLPWNHPRLAVYIVLTEGLEEVTLRVRLIDTDEERDPVAEETVAVSMGDPLEEVEVTVFLTELTFPEAGEYRVQLFADGEFLRERRLLVTLLEN